MIEEKSLDAKRVVEEWLSGRCDLVCVLGPTASGKTRYAVRLAKGLGEAEIISASSVVWCLFRFIHASISFLSK